MCSIAPEGTDLVLEAHPGSVISEIEFASYGTPGGLCGYFDVGTCHAEGTMAAIGGACVGREQCRIPATNAVFGDPCGGIYKRLYVSYRTQEVPTSSTQPSWGQLKVIYR
jgi:hypothetical protein